MGGARKNFQITAEYSQKAAPKCAILLVGRKRMMESGLASSNLCVGCLEMLSLELFVVTGDAECFVIATKVARNKTWTLFGMEKYN